MEKFKEEEIHQLFNAIVKINDFDICRNFFEDICTVKELQEMSQRFHVATELKKGKNYNEISKLTGASTATISRVNKCLMYGNGGYNSVIEISEENDE